MRKISEGSRRHNARPWGWTILAVAATAALLCGPSTGCSREAADLPPDRPARAPAPAPDDACGLSVDTSGWEAFRAIAREIRAGGKPSPERLGAVAEAPAVQTWCRSMAPYAPDAGRFANWLQAAYAQELAAKGPQKVNADRRAMAISYRYSLDRSAQVDSLLGEFTSGRLNCPLAEKVVFWVQPDSIPKPLTVAFLPAKPEIRFQDGVVLVDTGVLLAGSSDQLINQIAGLLYRRFLPGAGVNPLQMDGEASLAATFTLLRNEGVAAWIEDRPNTYFKADHPSLGKVAIFPEAFIFTANTAVGLADSLLPGLFADPARMQAEGQTFSRTMTASGSYTKLGYAMAAAIAGHFGPQRLRQAAQSPAGFLRAYQEAAALNPRPRPAPGDPDQPLYASLRPFDAQVADRVCGLLERGGP